MFLRQSRLAFGWLITLLGCALLTGCNNSDNSIVIEKSANEDIAVTPSRYGKVGDGLLNEQLEAIRAEFAMPALGGFIVYGDELIELDVAGVLVSTGQALVTKLDKWSIGSFSKSMTATVAARLVEQGLIRFDSRVSDVFPELIGKINPEFESVTLGPASYGDPEGQPSGHQMREGQWHPITPADRVDLPNVVGPAGLVSTTLTDLSYYLRAYLAGARGGDNLIGANSYTRLLTPVSPEYGLGWILTPNNNSFHHNGFTGTFYLDNSVLPEKNIAILAVTNGDTSNAKQAVEKAIQVMQQRFEAQHKDNL